MNLKALAATLLLCLTTSAAHAGVIEDMAAFERVYIPALALTNQPQAPADRVAGSLARLAAAWPGLRAALSGKGAALEKALRVTDAALPQAQRLLAEGKRAEAHEALEAIRPAFLEARRAAGIDLYVDRLTEFHDAMEELVKAAQSGAPRAQVEPLLEHASGLWTRAERPQFDAKLFGFDDAKYAELRSRVQAGRETLEALRAAIQGGDAARTRELAGALKSRFGAIYVMFGRMNG
jgi:hypothetical protein